MKNLKNKNLQEKLIIVFSGILFYVLLTNLPEVITGIKTFIGYFSPVITGGILAYIINPLAKALNTRLFKNIKNNKLKNILSNTLAFIIIILFITFSLIILIPQLIDSITLLSENLPLYTTTLEDTLHKFGLSRLEKYMHNSFSTSEKIIKTLASYAQNNASSIMETSLYAGKSTINLLIAFLLSMYLLNEKRTLKKGAMHLLETISTKEKYKARIGFLKKCDYILDRYIVLNLLDSIIIGTINAIIMAIIGLPYIGLISFAIAITNLIPTFGPLIGAMIGAFILVLVKPWYALTFIIVTLILQTFDGYILKPKLFGSSLGISGLWILIGIIVGGRMLGVIGILIAIPVVAILDLIYHNYLFPYLEKRFNIN